MWVGHRQMTNVISCFFALNKTRFIKWLRIPFACRNHKRIISSFVTFHHICHLSVTNPHFNFSCDVLPVDGNVDLEVWGQESECRDLNFKPVVSAMCYESHFLKSVIHQVIMSAF
jgi:hypothetical protein